MYACMFVSVFMCRNEGRPASRQEGRQAGRLAGKAGYIDTYVGK